ncbi:flagellar assembly protein FliH [Jatrophihabitans sp. GAS493]|uniref:FliH/SctL family protein n=1 Tax=Jatrophihabitans sp. GAS493 TaxID=1907575 RepID=UPI000BB99CD3|nr:FliH/SctL family protein [Jatrophihabitans sp. GAS493]SOD71336.1 flagellar assembly protein FliH [Jatrophihabitans sp. GAS493]
MPNLPAAAAAVTSPLPELPGAPKLAPLGFDIATSAGVPSTLTEQARSEARAVGYATGWSTGVREAREAMAAKLAAAEAEAAALIADTRARLATVLVAIDVAATALEQQSVPGAEEMEESLIGCAVELTEALLTRELSSIDTASDALARTLALAPAGEPVTISLAPRDYATLAVDPSGAVYPALVSTYRRSITVAADASLQPGDAVVQCGATTVDGRLSAGMQRVREALAS